MRTLGIANILHRETLAMIVGGTLFERGEQCFASGRVMKTDVTSGELRGTVKPNEASRAPYTTRIWIRDDGLAYECTCPIGEQRRFCKHAVAIALAHLEHERTSVERDLALLRDAMLAIGHPALVDGVLGLAKADADLALALKRVCLDALSQQS